GTEHIDCSGTAVQPDEWSADAVDLVVELDPVHVGVPSDAPRLGHPLPGVGPCLCPRPPGDGDQPGNGEDRGHALRMRDCSGSGTHCRISSCVGSAADPQEQGDHAGSSIHRHDERRWKKSTLNPPTPTTRSAVYSTQ